MTVDSDHGQSSQTIPSSIPSSSSFFSNNVNDQSSISSLLQIEADNLKLEGNSYFSKGDYVNAVDYYLRAIDKCPSVVAYYTNASMAFGKLEEHERAIEMASKAIQLESKFAKSYYRRAISLMALGQYRRAYDDLLRVAKASPKDSDVKRNLEACDKALLQASFAKAIHIDTWDLTEKNINELDEPDDNSYRGPKIKNYEITTELVKDLIEWFRKENRFPKKYLYKILYLVKNILSKEKNIVDIDFTNETNFENDENRNHNHNDSHDSRDSIQKNGNDNISNVKSEKIVTVCGDIHGQFFDLARIFDLNGFPSIQHEYLFNGDFVDRGSYSVETITVLLALKAALPNSFHLSRGNHECETINRMHGFYEECHRKYNGDDTVYSWFNKIFNSLPLGHVIGGAYFVVHGGLPSQASRQDFTIDHIQSLNRHGVPQPESIISQILWSDPRTEPGFGPSHRGEGVLWGPDITKSFLARNGLSAIIRSHVWETNGLKIEHDGQCITIFSAPNYTGAISQAAFINIKSDLKMKPVHFDAADYQGKAAKPRVAPPSFSAHGMF